jgi:RNase H
VESLVWADGSCNANGRRGHGGWAALIQEGETVREISGGVDGTTHNRMELTAICEALETLTGAIKVRRTARTSRSDLSPKPGRKMGSAGYWASGSSVFPCSVVNDDNSTEPCRRSRS